MSYVRSRAHRLGLTRDFYRNLDIHVHVLKARFERRTLCRITIATAIASALTKSRFRRDLAMTGEIRSAARCLRSAD